jgi:hypothetical protein
VLNEAISRSKADAIRLNLKVVCADLQREFVSVCGWFTDGGCSLNDLCNHLVLPFHGSCEDRAVKHRVFVE